MIDHLPHHGNPFPNSTSPRPLSTHSPTRASLAVDGLGPRRLAAAPPCAPHVSVGAGNGARPGARHRKRARARARASPAQHVTVLFCSFSIDAALRAGAAPEETFLLLNRAHDYFDGILARHGAFKAPPPPMRPGRSGG